MNTRRSFLGSILALGAAPAIVRAASLMKVVVTPSGIIIPCANRPGCYFTVDDDGRRWVFRLSEPITILPPLPRKPFA